MKQIANLTQETAFQGNTKIALFGLIFGPQVYVILLILTDIKADFLHWF